MLKVYVQTKLQDDKKVAFDKINTYIANKGLKHHMKCRMADGPMTAMMKKLPIAVHNIIKSQTELSKDDIMTWWPLSTDQPCWSDLCWV